jgi:hypothetical protein
VKALIATASLIAAVILAQGCAGIEVKPSSEFGYQRGFNPAG